MRIYFSVAVHLFRILLYLDYGSTETHRLSSYIHRVGRGPTSRRDTLGRVASLFSAPISGGLKDLVC